MHMMTTINKAAIRCQPLQLNALVFLKLFLNLCRCSLKGLPYTNFGFWILDLELKSFPKIPKNLSPIMVLRVIAALRNW